MREIKEIKEWAYAKLNISLDVTGCRADGYHEMVMIMQSVSLYDGLRIKLDNSGKVSAGSNLRYIPGDERNLAVKAALAFLDAVDDKDRGVRIELKKNLPVGAGMAGGSTDAAAVLRGLNRLYERPFSMEELEKLAWGVGSDVAFCVRGGTALAKGRGEILSSLPTMPDCFLAIVKPDFSISTPELFKKLDSAPVRTHPDTAGLIRALEEGSLTELCRRMYNVFEDVDDRRMRTVAEIKSRLLDFGALGAVMTGTGSAVFGVFTERAAADAACQALSREHGYCRTASPVKSQDILL